MNLERAIAVAATATTVALAVVWVSLPRVETKRVPVPMPLPENPTGQAMLRAFYNVQPMSVESGKLLDGRTWKCAYWDDTRSETASIANATVVVQWCVPNR